MLTAAATVTITITTNTTAAATTSIIALLGISKAEKNDFCQS